MTWWFGLVTASIQNCTLHIMQYIASVRPDPSLLVIPVAPWIEQGVDSTTIVVSTWAISSALRSHPVVVVPESLLHQLSVLRQPCCCAIGHPGWLYSVRPLNKQGPSFIDAATTKHS